jgi:hypothetical protein
VDGTEPGPRRGLGLGPVAYVHALRTVPTRATWARGVAFGYHHTVIQAISASSGTSERRLLALT